MDPNACLGRLLDALHDNDREEAIGALHDLAGWLENGGFMPDADPIWKVYRRRLG